MALLEDSSAQPRIKIRTNAVKTKQIGIQWAISGTTIASNRNAEERWLKVVARGKTVDIPMESKTFGLLVAVLFFLVSLLANLLQRRYAKARLARMLRKEGAVINFLGLIDKNLGKLEITCTLEVQGASSPQEMGKTIHMVRNNIQSTIANLEEHLRSFRPYRRKEKVRQRQKKGLEGSRQRPPA